MQGEQEVAKVSPKMEKALEIVNSFTYHKPTDSQIPKYETLRNMGKDLALKIQGLCPESRATSLAITKLEEAIMWANKSIACEKST